MPLKIRKPDNRDDGQQVVLQPVNPMQVVGQQPAQAQVQPQAESTAQVQLPAQQPVLSQTPLPQAGQTQGLAQTGGITGSIPAAPHFTEADAYNLVKQRSGMQPNERIAQYIETVNKQGLTPNIGRLADLWNGGESDVDKEKRLRRERNARIAAAVGDLFGNLINYVNTRNGMPAMQLNSSLAGLTERQKRLEQRRQALADRDFSMYYNAMLRDRAARAEAAAQAKKDKAAAAARAEARKDKADRLAYEKSRDNARLAYQIAKDAEAGKRRQAAQDEAARHNRAMESISRARVAKSGNSSNSRVNGRTGVYDTDYVYTNLYQALLKGSPNFRRNGDTPGYGNAIAAGTFRPSRDIEKQLRDFFENNPNWLEQAEEIVEWNNRTDSWNPGATIPTTNFNFK